MTLYAHFQHPDEMSEILVFHDQEKGEILVKSKCINVRRNTTVFSNCQQFENTVVLQTDIYTLNFY
jgi:hypothetical protein